MLFTGWSSLIVRRLPATRKEYTLSLHFVGYYHRVSASAVASSHLSGLQIGPIFPLVEKAYPAAQDKAFPTALFFELLGHCSRLPVSEFFQGHDFRKNSHTKAQARQTAGQGR
jgi:hypothetical protein